MRAGALRTALLYAVFGGIWIAVSDRVLEAMVSDAHAISVIQSWKGWAYVAVSALLIYAVVQRELGARAHAEAALASSEERYHTLVDLANDAIIVVDIATGLIIDANRKAGELVGLPRERLVGMRQLDLHPASEQERCKGVFTEAVSKGKLLVGTACLSHRDGRIIPAEVSLSVIEVGGRKVLMSILRDISERQEAERLLRLEKERAQQYLDVAGVMLLVLDPEGRVSLINRMGARMLGFTEEEILGKNWFEAFLPERIRSPVRTVFARLMTGEEAPVGSYENPVVTRDGSERLVAWHNTLIRDEAGRIVASLSSGEDITERAKAQAEARSRLEHLATLHDIDLVISASLDLRVTLAQLLEHVADQFGLDAADVLLLNPHTQTLEYAAGRGFRSGGIKDSRLKLGEGIAGLAALERRSIRIPDLLDPASGFVRAPLLEGEGFIAYYAVPLRAKGRVQGVLEALHRAPLTLNEEQQGFLEAIASQAAIAIDNATLFEDLQRSHSALALAYDATLEGWAHALDLRDKTVERHSERVTEMTVRLARELGMTEEEIVHVRRGALLHDIGKIGIPDDILRKPGPLTPEEWETMRRHPRLAFEMLQPIAYLRPALDIPYAHHEHWDGTGYPRGLKGEQIPLAARIFALADVWDALHAVDRPYRASLSREDTCARIRALAGTQLDPAVVEAFLRLDEGSCRTPAQPPQ
jgi:PAS domain S-box-containing protein/putative nucleotidyltransferase with HDIG domain